MTLTNMVVEPHSVEPSVENPGQIIQLHRYTPVCLVLSRSEMLIDRLTLTTT